MAGICGRITEKADTRNWRTLPYSISYAHVPLKDEENLVGLQFTGVEVTPDNQQIAIPANASGTRFFVYTTL